MNDTLVFNSIKKSVFQLQQIADTATVFIENLKEISNNPNTSIGVLLHDEQAGTKLSTEHPIDLCRYQVLNCYSGRINLINSGGESKGETDLAEAVKAAVINKRAGGAGLIMGRKVFQRPFDEGIELINAVQEVYLAKEITIA